MLQRTIARLKSTGSVAAEPAVVSVCFLLPDLIDKPLWAAGIGMGRFVAHTLLFVFLVGLAFATVKRGWGALALAGGMLHLLSDADRFTPWLYPFADYHFPKLDFWDFMNWRYIGPLLGQLAFLVTLAVGFTVLYRWWKKGRIE